MSHIETPTRRDLIKYAVGATLTSALPASAKNRLDTTKWPLVVDLSGPMAFEYSTDAQGRSTVEVWLPHLQQIAKHEAGIVTSELSFPLGDAENDYTITGPSSSSKGPTPYPTSGCTVYNNAQYPLNPNRSQNRFIHLTLPMPHFVVALLPVPAKIYTTPTAPPGFDNLATGLRLLYDQAGTVQLLLTGTTTQVTQFDFDPAPGETQLNMSIQHAPFNSDDPVHANAENVFTELAVLFFNARLKVNFDTKATAGLKPNMFATPLHPCKAPVIYQS